MRLSRRRKVRDQPRGKSLASFAAELANDEALRARYRSDPIATLDENDVVLTLNRVGVLADLPEQNLDDVSALLRVLKFIEESA